MKFLDRIKSREEKREANKRAWAEKQEQDRLARLEAREVRDIVLAAKEEGLVAPSEKKQTVVNKVKLKDLKKQLLTGDNTRKVLEKVLQVAMDDEHQGQVACLKMCMDRMLPMSAFEEKDGSGFSGGVTIVIGQVEPPHRVLEHE